MPEVDSVEPGQWMLIYQVRAVEPTQMIPDQLKDPLEAFHRKNPESEGDQGCPDAAPSEETGDQWQYGTEHKHHDDGVFTANT